MDDELALVSSLYGEGTILCWLLTILACLVSWTCDKRKRKSDHLNPDFIGILTLPSVALAHTIYQTRSLNSPASLNIQPASAIQLSRALEASLTVTETFMILSVVLFLVAFPARCYKRAILTALVGLFCLATEYLVYSQLTSSPNHRLMAIKSNFSRSFVSDTAIIITVIISLILTCISIAFCLALYVFHNKPCRSTDPVALDTASVERIITQIGTLHTPEAILDELARHQMGPSSREDRFMYLSLFSLVFLPASLVSSVMGMYIGPRGLGVGKPESSSWWSRFAYIAQRFLAAFFPKTTATFADLDQAVAVAAGCVILSFTLWTVGSNWYSDWKIEHALRLQERQREDIRLRELRRRLAVLVQGA